MFKDYTILLVEDDIEMQKYMNLILKDECSKLFIASNGKEGFEIYKSYSPDIIISDLNMPEVDGLSMCRDIKKNNLSQLIILFTGHGDVVKLGKAINIGVDAFISKPILDINILFDSIKKLIKQVNYNKEINHIKKKVFEQEREVENLITQVLYDNNDYINYDLFQEN